MNPFDLGYKLVRDALVGLSGGLAGTQLETSLQDSDPPVCVIHDVFAHTGAYIVRKPGGGTKLALHLADVSPMPLGARGVGHFNIGDPVYCVFPQRTEYGLIIGAASPQSFDPRFILPDSLVMRSLAGFFQDQMHHQPYQDENNDLANFSAGRPVDSLPGDRGFINELGVAIWLGKLMAQLRASDVAKVEAFWGDNLLRLFGYNMESFTAGRELYAFDDEGEYSEVERWTPFPWEALGAYEPGTPPMEDFEGDAGGLARDQENSRYEPDEGWQQVMVPRFQTLRGYLGDGVREQGLIRPINPPEINTADNAEPPRGLLEIQKGLDGTFAVRSAKQIILEKSMVMPVPKQLKQPDDPSGDTAETYKASNEFGDGPDQTKEPYEWSGDDTAARPTELSEYLAYLFGKYGMQAVDAHESDWETAEEGDLSIADGVPNELDSELFSGLQFKYITKLPQYGEITIDQRDSHDVRYYRTKAGLYILDDGSVVIEDGYASQIIMSGGNITTACQGDILNRPGRSHVTWAPRDIVARAGWAAEVSAAKSDLRLKAEKNLHVLAGNDGTNGSLLLECRATSRPSEDGWDGRYGTQVEGGGIIAKADDSFIQLWGKNIYGGVPEDEAGFIALNAGSGPATIAGGKVAAEARNQFSVLVGGDGADTDDPGQFNMTVSGAEMLGGLDVVGDINAWPGSKGSGAIKVGGSLSVKGSIQAEGSCVAVQHFSSGVGGEVGSNADYQFTPDPASEGSDVTDSLETVKDDTFGEFEEQAFESPDGQLRRDLWNVVGFSFRKSEDDYRLDDTFKVPEVKWQQLYRVNASKKTWDEPVINAPDGTPTRPYPGHEIWIGGQRYVYIEPGSSSNFDFGAGKPKPRTQQKNSSDGVTQSSLDDEYVINVQEED